MTAPKRRPGRPPLVEGERSRYVTIMLPESMLRRIEAHRGPESMSSWLRGAIERALGRRERVCLLYEGDRLWAVCGSREAARRRAEALRARHGPMELEVEVREVED